jgi:hypothetical protein
MCKTTRFDTRCIASCLAICLTVCNLINKRFTDNEIEPLVRLVQNQTIQILGDHLSTENRESFLWHTDQARTLEELELDEPNSIGYTYKCLASGFYGLRSKHSFEKTLNNLIQYGGDEIELKQIRYRQLFD